MIGARSLLWDEKPKRRILPDFLSCVDDLFQLLAFHQIDGGVELVHVAESVNEEEIDVVGPQRRQPLVDHLQHFARHLRHVLGDEEDLLANLGFGVKPPFKTGLSAINLGCVENANAVGVCRTQDAFVAPDRTLLEDRDLDAGLPQLALGEDWIFRNQVLRIRCLRTTQSRGSGERTAWRNVRRSVRSVSSWAMTLDSS